MKKIYLTFIAVALLGCAQTATAAETLLVCDGASTKSMLGPGGKKVNHTFTITKTGNKVTSVKFENTVYGLKKTDINKEGKGPIYVQLIVESDKLILRIEVTDHEEVRETVIFNTGEYHAQLKFGFADGKCTAGKKVF